MITFFHPRILRISGLLGLSAVLGATGQAGNPVVLKPTYKVRIEGAVMIPMRDGKRLSADLIRPDVRFLPGPALETAGQPRI